MNGELLLGTGGSLIAMVVAMVVGWVSRGFYGKVLRPLIDGLTYKGPSLEGEWETRVTFLDDSYNQFQVKISRSGYALVGIARCVEGHSKGHEFEYRGEFAPPLMTATYRDLSPLSTERGAAALILSKNGGELRGQVVYSDDEKVGVFATECVLRRATSKFAW